MRMRTPLLYCLVVTLAACARGGEQAGSGQAATPPTLNLADVAGRWSMETLALDKDTVLATSEMTATATTEGWTEVLPARPPIPLHVIVAGDSVVAHQGPFESVFRPGVQVTVENTFRWVNGRIEGIAVAHYQGATPDSVLRFRVRGTRVP